MKQDRTAVKNIVLVHGGFVDESGWEKLYKTLKRGSHAIYVSQPQAVAALIETAAQGVAAKAA